ncbi:MAG: thioredoxin domain-containing protein [bacterium]
MKVNKNSATYLIFLILLVMLIMQFSDKLRQSSEGAEESAGRKPLPSQEEIKKLPADGGPDYNRLIFEKSPYLLQHAGNPVNWYPWGEEAFAKARKEDKPIFLSIGYSTCHWCHVMEHESFQDTAVARVMNEAFVCIKVDREERPDIDQIYMAVCQALTQRGGWPLTIIMTPEKRPFFAGTYFPKISRYQQIGMMDLVPKISELWKTQREKIIESSTQIVDYLQKSISVQPGEELSEDVLHSAFNQLLNKFDEKHGGFGSAPKFPSPHNFTFLLRYFHRTGNDQAIKMVEKTLQRLRLGGIFDHVGFGFHRYSTDVQWMLPHFEKMLYDQAMMAIAYLETFQVTRKNEYAETAREIFTYVLRDMTAPEGGFYSAEDADSEGEEGLFYLWSPQEIKDIVGEEKGSLIIKLFNVEDAGNFLDQASGQKTGKNILHLEQPLTVLAEQAGFQYDELHAIWKDVRQKLFKFREKRIHPLKDDKILTDWNGLMIAALAKGAAVLDEPQYAQAASRAADFIWEQLRDEEGLLMKRHRQGESGLQAHVDDYAFFVWGLLELYEATYEVKFLRRATLLNENMLNLFWDDEKGGLFFTAENAEELLIRNKEIYDGALPSGNSVAALNLLRISRFTGNPEFETKAAAIGKCFSNQITRVASGYTQYLTALDFAIGPSIEVVIAGKSNKKDSIAMIKALQQIYVPNKVTLFRPVEVNKPPIVEIAPFTENQSTQNGKATAYVCQNYACKAPTTRIDEMLNFMREFAK